MMTPAKTLAKYRIRSTEIRERILGLFQDCSFALSHSEVLNRLGEGADRVTVYRTLNTFVEHGLIHKVVDGQGVTNFALCQSNCRHQEVHHHDHLHFQCKKCGHTFCLEKVTLPSLNIPDGFQLEEINIRAEGICEDCRENPLPGIS
ncbi:MAG: transcriptional repressor [Calditrichaeota bacterium]|nr:transcriptional repressor [Calditrichota bacterium]